MFGIACDARKGGKLGIETLFLVDRNKTKRSWWTSDDFYLIRWYEHKEAALSKAACFRFNNTRVLDRETIRAMIEQQESEINNNLDSDQSWDAHKNSF